METHVNAFDYICENVHFPADSVTTMQPSTTAVAITTAKEGN